MKRNELLTPTMTWMHLKSIMLRERNRRANLMVTESRSVAARDSGGGGNGLRRATGEPSVGPRNVVRLDCGDGRRLYTFVETYHKKRWLLLYINDTFIKLTKRLCLSKHHWTPQLLDRMSKGRHLSTRGCGTGTLWGAERVHDPRSSWATARRPAPGNVHSSRLSSGSGRKGQSRVGPPWWDRCHKDTFERI